MISADPVSNLQMVYSSQWFSRRGFGEKMKTGKVVFTPLPPLLWCEPGSNRRHKDFQSFALPTELPHRFPFGTAKIGLIRNNPKRFSYSFFYICDQCILLNG